MAAVASGAARRSGQGLRRLVAAAAVTALTAACAPDSGDGGGGGSTAAASWPSGAVRIMAPADPGGGWDQTSRAVQEGHTERRYPELRPGPEGVQQPADEPGEQRRRRQWCLGQAQRETGHERPDGEQPDRAPPPAAWEHPESGVGSWHHECSST